MYSTWKVQLISKYRKRGIRNAPWRWTLNWEILKLSLTRSHTFIPFYLALAQMVSNRRQFLLYSHLRLVAFILFIFEKASIFEVAKHRVASQAVGLLTMGKGTYTNLAISSYI